MSANDRRQSANSFLPEDYLQKKAERRAIVISLFLFLVVVVGIAGGFFVTYHHWMAVKRQQEQVNRDFASESQKIEQLKVLEAQRDELKEKAEVTLALVERVPRSILMAELINRMPKQLTLTEMALKSKRITEPPKIIKPTGLAGPQTLAQIKSAQAQGVAAGAKPTSDAPKPVPPKFDFRLELMGLSATDEEIADYYQSLVACPLLERVDMIYSTDITVDEIAMRKFRIEASLRPDADARTIEPLHVPRLGPKPGATAHLDHNPLDPTFPREDAPAPAPVAGAPDHQE